MVVHTFDKMYLVKKQRPVQACKVEDTKTVEAVLKV